MIVLIAKMMVNHLMLGYFFLGQAHINVLGLAKTERSQSPAVVLGGSHLGMQSDGLIKVDRHRSCAKTVGPNHYDVWVWVDI